MSLSNTTFGGAPFSTNACDISVAFKQNPGLILNPTVSEVGGLYSAYREIAGSQYTLQNADYFAGVGFQQINPALTSWAFVLLAGGGLAMYKAVAGSLPGFTWTRVFFVDNTGTLDANTYAQGIPIENFLLTSDNISSPTFDWGVVVSRASTEVTSNTALLFKDYTYTFLTPGQMSGARKALIGTPNGTSFVALGNNDCITASAWSDSVVQGISFHGRQDGTVPTAGSGLNLTNSSHMEVRFCVFLGSWNCITANNSWSDLKFTELKCTNYMNIGLYFGSGTGSPSVLQLNHVLSSPASVHNGAQLTASGFVFDGNITTIGVGSCGGVGNVGDGISYGDCFRMQNSFATTNGPSLISFTDCGTDHWSNMAFNLGNWIGPATGTGPAPSSPGSGVGTIAKVTMTRCLATSSNQGIFADNLAGLQLSVCDFSSNGQGYYFGVNCANVVATGCVVEAFGNPGVAIVQGMTGLNWSGGRIGGLHGTATGIGVAIIAGSGTTDFIYFSDVSMHLTQPINNFIQGTNCGFNIVFDNCPGFTPTVGGVSTPSFPATTTSYTNNNLYAVGATANSGSGGLSYTIHPQQLNTQDANFTRAVAANLEFYCVIPPGATFTPTYGSGTPTWELSGL